MELIGDEVHIGIPEITLLPKAGQPNQDLQPVMQKERRTHSTDAMNQTDVVQSSLIKLEKETEDPYSVT